MDRRRLTKAEKALIERMATRLSQGALATSRPRIVVADEVDEQGQVHWSTSMVLGEILPNA